MWLIFSRKLLDLLRCVLITKALHAQHITNEYLYIAPDSKHLSRYVSSSMDTELRFVLLNHCTSCRISSSNSLAVFHECLTWSLMQGSKNGNRMSRNIRWEKSGPPKSGNKMCWKFCIMTSSTRVWCLCSKRGGYEGKKTEMEFWLVLLTKT
jgi:hypothetical protein